MEQKMEYRESSHYYSTKFMRNSKAVGVLWGIFTVCYAIITIVVFMQDQWIGNSDYSKGQGNFGLWRWCTDSQDGSEICRGRLDDFSSILSPAFQAATVFVGLSVIIIVLCIVALILFFMCNSSDVFKICGSMQLLSGLCLAVGILSYPAGWDNEEVKRICQSDDYNLACLAFTLGGKKVKMHEEPAYMTPASLYKGEINSGFIGDNQSLSGSRKSMNLQPVMLMPHGPGELDRYSEYSQRTGRSNPSINLGQYPNIQHNFQL
jgi:hypothetical protein